MTEQADDASALLDALEATPAVVMGRSYGGAVAIGLAIRHSEQVRALVLLEGDALGLSPAGLEWTKRLRDVAARDGHDAVYEALIEEVMGEGVWDSFPEEVRRVLAQNGPALLAELHYVDEPMPDAAAFAAIDVPSLLVAGSDSPPEQRDMTEKMAEVLPNARLVQVAGGHLGRCGRECRFARSAKVLSGSELALASMGKRSSDGVRGLALAFLVLGRRRRVADRRSCPLAAAGDLGQTPVEPLAKFVGVIVVLGPALAGDGHAGRGHAREASDSDELPGHPHGP